MLFDVVAAEARDHFKVWVRFEDGLEGEVDLSHLVGKGVFKRWSESPSEFGQLKVDRESGTIVWPGGLDVAPDALYRDIAHGNVKTRTHSAV
jgi:hypothetical protein